MQKDKLETERLVIKMLLIASNELNNEKLPIKKFGTRPVKWNKREGYN